MRVHLPLEWGSDQPACGVTLTLRDEVIVDASEVEDVTCVQCATKVIEATLSDVRKVGC